MAAAPTRARGLELPQGEEKTARVRTMFDTIAPRYDLVNRVITLGLDTRWRRATVRALGLGGGSSVLDLACGTGDLGRIGAGSGLRMVGVDLSLGMLRAGAGRRTDAPVEADGSALPFADSAFDGVVCGYALRNFTDLDAVLAETARVLRPGGRLAVLEVSAPSGGWLRIGHEVWFAHVVPRIGAVLSDAAAYRYLPASTAYLPDPPELRRRLVAAGFSGAGRRLLSGGLSQLLTATRQGLPPGPRGAT